MYTVATDPLTLFRATIYSTLTRLKYEKRLDLFFKFINLDGSSLGAVNA